MSRFSEQRWLALFAATIGYMLDAMDGLLYVFAIQTLRAEFHWNAATAGLASSATLIASSIGGILAGILADKFGRSRILIDTVVIYSLRLRDALCSGPFWRVRSFSPIGESSPGFPDFFPPLHRRAAQVSTSRAPAAGSSPCSLAHSSAT